MADHPPYTIPATEVRVLQSSAHADRQYQVSVAFPFGYDDHPDRRWPVIYVLDADQHFALVVGMVRFMNIRVPFCSELPDAIVVGIGYPLSGPLLGQLHESMHRRLEDLQDERDEDDEDFMQSYFPVDRRVISGNAAGFLEFIERDVISLVEREYRGDPADRTLMGHSSGAWFALYVLFNQPALFRRYVVASVYPDPVWEIAYAEHHRSLPARLHLVQEGSDDAHIERHQAIVGRLQSRNYEDFVFTEEILRDITHCAMVPRAFQSGLLAVFGSAEV